MIYETKADALEATFETPEAGVAETLAELKSDIGRLNQRVGDMHRAGARPALAGAGAVAIEPERKAFVDRYLRKGLESGVELKSLNAATGIDGGYAVPQALDRLIDATLRDISPIRALANVVQVGSSNYRKLITKGGVISGWVSDIAARPETDTPDFIEIAPPMGDLYANPAASQSMLDDAAFDVESWLAGEIATEFARAEGQAFVAGNGTNRPKGFLAYATSASDDAVRAFGTLQHLATGVSGNFAATSPQDRLVDLVHALKPAYRQGAAFVMSSGTLARIRKMKTTDGDFIWRPGLEQGQPATLLGYPVIEAQDMPEIGADTLSIAFGNFKAGYVIAERSETRVLRDPFSNKPFVHFYAAKRVGGAVVNSEAIKLMKFSVS